MSADSKDHQVFEFLEGLYLEFNALLGPITDNFSNLGDRELFRPTTSFALGNSIQQEKLEPGESARSAGCYISLYVSALDKILNSRSLKDFLSLYKGAVFKLKEVGNEFSEIADPSISFEKKDELISRLFSETIENVKMGVSFESGYLIQDIFRSESAFSRTPENVFYRRNLALRRAFLSLMDLCLLRSRANASAKSGKRIVDENLLIVADRNRKWLSGAATSIDPALKEKLSRHSVENSRFSRKKVSDLVRPSILFENNLSLKSYIQSSFSELLEFEPYLIFTSAFRDEVFRALPVYSKRGGSDSLAKILRRGEGKFTSPRDGIRLKRMLLIAGSLLPPSLADEKSLKLYLVDFLKRKRICSKSTKPKLISDTWSEIF